MKNDVTNKKMQVCENIIIKTKCLFDITVHCKPTEGLLDETLVKRDITFYRLDNFEFWYKKNEFSQNQTKLTLNVQDYK